MKLFKIKSLLSKKKIYSSSFSKEQNRNYLGVVFEKKFQYWLKILKRILSSAMLHTHENFLKLDKGLRCEEDSFLVSNPHNFLSKFHIGSCINLSEISTTLSMMIEDIAFPGGFFQCNFTIPKIIFFLKCKIVSIFSGNLV